jgi:hypothetical protein
MNAEQLTVIAGAILSLAFSYKPGLKTSYAGPGAEALQPRIETSGYLLVIAPGDHLSLINELHARIG